LRLRAFAPGRSYRLFKVSRSGHPRAFAELEEWLDGTRREVDLPPDLRGLGALTGVLLTDAEAAALPSAARPGWGAGNHAASVICPAIAGILARPPALSALPAPVEGDLQRLGFAVLPPLLTPTELSAVQAYYRQLDQGGWLSFDRGTSGRKVINSDPVAQWLAEAALPLIERDAGEPLKPSYGLAALYGPGDALERHTDREMCELTVSLSIDHTPEGADGQCAWPITVHAPGGDIAIRQPLGGGVVFRGRKLPHSRAALPAGARSQMVFLHYVAADYAGSLD
jgi:hypothetical protein